MAMGVGPGDEVIVPAMTFIASANIVELLGATTVLVDVDPATLLVTPEAVARAVTARTKAVIPVHLYGLMADIRAMREAIDAEARAGSARSTSSRIAPTASRASSTASGPAGIRMPQCSPSTPPRT